jgi:hypothetical protein
MSRWLALAFGIMQVAMDKKSEYSRYGRAAEGPLLGVPEGSMLLEGERLGTALGTRLGLMLGTTLGVVLGSTLGTVLGAKESVGVPLGGLEPVGCALAVGNELG